MNMYGNNQGNRFNNGGYNMNVINPPLDPVGVIRNLNLNNFFIPGEFGNFRNDLFEILQTFVFDIQNNLPATQPDGEQAIRVFAYFVLSGNNYNNEYFEAALEILLTNVIMLARFKRESFSNSYRILRGSIYTYICCRIWYKFWNNGQNRPNFNFTDNQNFIIGHINNCLNRFNDFDIKTQEYFNELNQRQNNNQFWNQNNNYQNNGNNYNNFYNGINGSNSSGLFNNSNVGNFNRPVNERPFVSGRIVKNTNGDRAMTETNQNVFEYTDNNSVNLYQNNSNDEQSNIEDINNTSNTKLDDISGKDAEDLWYPTSSQPCWKSYDKLKFRCYIVFNDKGHPIQEFEERNINMEEKDHYINEYINDENKSSTNELSKNQKYLDKAIDNVNAVNAMLEKMKTSTSDKTVIDNTVLSDELTVSENLNSALFSIESNIKNNKDENKDKIYIVDDVVLENPISTTYMFDWFLNHIVELHDFNEVRVYLEEYAETVDERLWNYLVKICTYTINSILTDIMLFQFTIDDIIEDLPELNSYIINEKGQDLYDLFIKVSNAVIKNLFISTKQFDKNKLNDILSSYGIENHNKDNVENDSEEKENNVFYKQLTLLMRRICVISIINSNINFSSLFSRKNLNLLDKDKNPDIYKIVSLVFKDFPLDKQKFSNIYIKDESGDLIEIHQTALNEESYTVKFITTCDIMF